MDLELLPDFLRAVLGSGVTLQSYKIANSYDGYLVLLVDVTHPAQSVVIKLAKANAPYTCLFGHTAAVHALVRAKTSVPVAEVLAVDTSYDRWPWRYIIMSRAPGVEWAAALPQMDHDEQEQAYSQIGHAVAELHTIRFGAFGELNENGTVAQASTYLQTLVERATARIEDSAQAAAFVRLLRDRAALFDEDEDEVAQPSLCHDDLHKHNILFNLDDGIWRLSAILDFDSAYAGQHESDLSRLDLWRGMIGPGFWEAYTEVLPVSPMYAQRRPIHQLLWCLEYGSTSPQHQADTADLLRQLGLGE